MSESVATPAKRLPVLQPLHLPRTLFANGAIDALAPELLGAGVARPLLVTDKGVIRAGLVDRVLAALAPDVEPVLFDEVTENPLFSNADEGAEAYRAHHCDGVVALGGGSVIDVAKYVAVLATHRGSVAQYAGNAEARIGPTAPLIVLPTTAGTGSESNGTAGIHPTPTEIAVGIFSHHIMPRLVILDPELTVTMPPRLTAATGIDALSHCVEGFLSRNDAPFLNEIALDGARRAWRYLPRAVATGTDIEARAEMMLAAYAGGVAIGMGLGPAHAVAITCGDQGFHHGVLSGIGLVATLDAVASRRPERAAALRRALGLDEPASLANAIASLMRELELPATLGELGYSARDPQSLARVAHESFFNRSAWHHPSVAEYEDMIEQSLR
jgi:alcohol dehydrogenase class IV